MLIRHASPIVVALTLTALCGCGSDDHATSTTDRHPQTVQLALDFTPNAVHAPLYAAIRTHADTTDGVHLVIRQPGSGPDALKQVAAGNLDLGVLDIHDLAIARERGIDVVGVAELVRKPLAALVTKASIKRPRDLEGHDVGVSGLPSDPAFLDAIIAHDGGKLSRVHQITIGFNAVSGILAGKVDGAPVFWNAEGVALKQRGMKVNEFRVEDYGAPAYPEVVLITARRDAGARARSDSSGAAGDSCGCYGGGARSGCGRAADRARGADRRHEADRGAAGGGGADLRDGPAAGPGGARAVG